MSSITNRGVREPSSETSSGTTPVKVDSAKAASPPPQQRTRGKKIWIDLENSPHVPFFKPIIEELKTNIGVTDGQRLLPRYVILPICLACNTSESGAIMASTCWQRSRDSGFGYSS